VHSSIELLVPVDIPSWYQELALCGLQFGCLDAFDIHGWKREGKPRDFHDTCASLPPIRRSPAPYCSELVPRARLTFHPAILKKNLRLAPPVPLRVPLFFFFLGEKEPTPTRDRAKWRPGRPPPSPPSCLRRRCLPRRRHRYPPSIRSSCSCISGKALPFSLLLPAPSRPNLWCSLDGFVCSLGGVNRHPPCPLPCKSMAHPHCSHPLLLLN
jgi:hypothetical protein